MGSMDVFLDSEAEFVDGLSSNTPYKVKLVLSYNVDGELFPSSPVFGKIMTLPEGEKEIERAKGGIFLIVKVSFKGQGASPHPCLN